MSHSAQKKKGSNFSINIQVIPKTKTSNFSSFSKVNNPKDISHDLPIMTTPLDFIKHKKKFIIQDSFDKKGTKDFLKSKEEAMMEIKLDDEILDENKDESKYKNKFNTNSYFTETKNDTNETKNFHRSQKRTNTISPVLRKRKTKFGKSKYSHFAKNLDENKKTEKNANDTNNIFINNKIGDDSKDSNLIYKFILENANESEDNFQKKFDKIVKDVENKQKKKKVNKAIFQTTIYQNKGNSKKFKTPKIKKKKTSFFKFSEQAKMHMMNDGIEESSISGISKNSKWDKNSSFDNIKVSGKNNKAFKEISKTGIINNKNRDSIFFILENLD